MFTFSGLATGLDSASIVEQLVQLEARPIQRLESRRSDLVSSRSQFSAFRSKLTDLESALKKLGSRDDLDLFKATSQDESAVRVSADTDAADGSYNVEVSNLAKAQSMAFTSPYTDPDTAFGGGQIGINVGGTELTPINIDTDDTIYDIRDKINESGASVDASVIFDGTNYQLTITSQETGVANGFEIGVTGFPPGPSLSAEVLQDPEDAAFSVNGIDITSASNTIDDAVQGVSIELRSTTDSGESVGIQIERDNEAVADQFNDFIDAYNDVLDLIDSEDGDSDVALRSIKNQLRDTVAGTLDDSEFGLIALSQLGVETNGAGRLELDRTVFDRAFDADLDTFIETLAGKSDGSSEGLIKRFENILRGDPDNPVGDLNGDGEDEGAVGILTQGFGALSLRESAVNDRIRSIDDELVRLEDRLVRFEERQTLRFANLESLVSQFQAQGAALNSF
jgi:flagellar hook-associated protein 2